MALDATVGGASANSYLTVAEADAYFASRYNLLGWKQIATAVKENLLIEATRMLDNFVEWNGSLYNAITANSQALRWPRYYAMDLDGRLIPSNIVPTGIKNLVCELAQHILSNGGYNAEYNPLSLIKLSSITLKFNEKVSTSGFPQRVIDLIAPWGSYSLPQAGSITQSRLVRT